MDLYVLDDAGDPRKARDVFEWAGWYETSDEQRIVKQTELGGVLVSTVFLGIDHSFRPGSIPTLFETMVFGGDLDGWQERYATRTGALDGHEAAVKMVKEVKT